MAFERSVKNSQIRPVLEGMKLDGVAGTPVMTVGSNQIASVTDNGVGDWTLDLTPLSLERAPVVTLTSDTADVVASVAAVSSTSLQLLAVDATDGTTAKDAILNIVLVGWKSSTES